MTTPEALTALADRVEREEPSRELDTAIESEIHGMLATTSYPPWYTANLHAAARISNWVIAHLSEIGGDGLPMCVLTNGTQEAEGYCLNAPSSGVTALARALASASLRARAADMQARAVGAQHPSPEQKGSE